MLPRGQRVDTGGLVQGPGLRVPHYRLLGVAVRLGARNTDGQTVLSGLSAGERVAIGDFSKLKDGAKVKIEP